MSYHIEMDAGQLALRFVGTIVSEDLEQSLRDIEGIEAALETAPDRITDLSQSDTGQWSFSLIEQLAARRRAAHLKNKVRSAIYAPTDLQFGYSRMFQMLNDNPQIEVEVFRDRVESEAWLRNGSTQRA